MIVALRTDSPTAEILLIGQDGRELKKHVWHADRTLAKDLLKVLREQMQAVGGDWKQISGVAVFKGPGSFTGLRIGITVANSLAYGLDVPIVATQGDDWVSAATARLKSGENDRLALPFYGGEANITLPRK